MKLAQSLHNSIMENSYRLNARKRQFNTFNKQMKVVTIPILGILYLFIDVQQKLVSRITVLDDKSHELTSNAKIYQEIMASLPPESISVPIILHGILEQVCIRR
jgi:hypothetical protein